MVRHAVAGVAVVMVLAGCAGTSDGAAAPSTAVVDVTHGTVAEPLDEYMPTAAQRDVFPFALEIEAARCAAAQGVAYRPVRRGAGQVDTTYGLWQLDRAEREGYTISATAAITAIEQRDKAMSEHDRGVVEGCMMRPEMGAIKFPTSRMATDLPFLKPLSTTRSMDTDEGLAVIDQWRDCLKAKGVAPPSRPEKFVVYDWTPPQVEAGTTREAMLQTAVTDVHCKESVSLVQKLADIDARRQQSIIRSHRAELIAFRDRWLSVLTAAQKVVDGYHGV